MPAPANGMDAGTASQLIPGVRWTRCRPARLWSKRPTPGVRVGPMPTKESLAESDLEPRQGGVPFRKLACRSAARDEVRGVSSRSGLRLARTIDRPTA
jgi:hypothetical protein